MKRYSHLATTTVFQELRKQGRSQRWLAGRLKEQLGGEISIWEPRLSDWKAGRREMPDEAIEVAFTLLGLPETALSFFAHVSHESDTSSLVSNTEAVTACPVV